VLPENLDAAVTLALIYADDLTPSSSTGSATSGSYETAVCIGVCLPA
jgi:hypothetical protein